MPVLALGYSEVPPGRIAAVVTCLEMTERPSLRREPIGQGWSVEHVERPPLERYRDLFRRIGQDWLWLSRLNLDDAKLAAIIHDPRVEVRTLRVDGRDEGLMELDFREPGTCELLFFGVTRGFVGRGAGRWLMNRAVACAWSRPIGRFWVHTCTLDHPAALDFYVRSGFRAFARRVEIADDPRLAGTMPRSAAPQVPIIE